ncbi:hypothetical protein R1sor_001435 [Riccia sorocarpa]|uniref:Maturase K n=1 Tax=Riccia sorocarpa TaxID=122646 RepID=A0ABD3GWA0_9MARC
MASRSNLYDYLYTLDFDELLDLYQTLLESSCEHYDLELDDTIYEGEQILFSADDEVIIMAIMEHYPHGYLTERLIPVPPPSPPHNDKCSSMAILEEIFCLSIHCRQGEEVLSTLYRYNRWQIELWYRHFERLALSVPLPLAVHHSFVRDVILDEIYNRDKILAAAKDRAWVQEMSREANGWNMLPVYGLPQIPLPRVGFRSRRLDSNHYR